MTNYQIELIQIIKALLNGQPVEKRNISVQMYAFAASHSLEHILGYAASEPSIQMETARAVIKQESQLKGAAEIMAACEKSGIYVMPLKGICTVNRYPDPVLRSMGDIDLLYKAEQLESLRDMMERLGYDWKCEGAKHEIFTNNSFVRAEMHHSMIEIDSEYFEYYADIWNQSVPKDGCRYVHELTAESELIYFMVHLIGHFKYGGVGIRFIMDLYVYNHSDLNFDYVQSELEKLHLFKFYQTLTALSEKWFGDNDTDDATILKLEDYIISSGLYGTAENTSALSMSNVNGKVAYFIKHCFPDFRYMKSIYSWLGKFPFLLPYAWIKRVITTIKLEKNALSFQLYIMKHGNPEQGKEIKAFWKECGLE